MSTAHRATYRGVARIDAVAVQSDSPSILARHRRLFYLLLVLSAAVCGYLFARFGLHPLDSELFAISSIDIEAEVPVLESEVRALLPDLTDSGLFGVDSEELARHVLAHPWVADVLVRKEFPHSIRIFVTAKKPAFVLLSDRGLEYADTGALVITSVTRQAMSQLDLPVLSFDSEDIQSQWNMSEVAELVAVLVQSLGPLQTLSEIALGEFPYFKVFLSSRMLELSFNYDSWTEQLANVLLLLGQPIEQVQKAQKIDLTLPKKAIVSGLFSK